jgi:hypothetical protein
VTNTLAYRIVRVKSFIAKTLDYIDEICIDNLWTIEQSLKNYWLEGVTLFCSGRGTTNCFTLSFTFETLFNYLA